MGVILTKIETLRDDSRTFQSSEEDAWKGKSGKNINDMCKSPVLSKLDKTRTSAANMERIVKYVNHLNSEITEVKKIDEKIAVYISRINDYNNMSSIKKAAISGYDTQCYSQIDKLKKERAGHANKIKQYENNINLIASKIA